MMVRIVRRRMSAWAVLAVASALGLVACGGPSGPPRPTDPRQILVTAIAATASLPTLRLHGEIVADMGPGAPGQTAGVEMVTLDADIDLATRQFVGRATILVPGVAGVGNPAQIVNDVIVTRTATFNRDSQTGRWSKVPTSGIDGPTNVQIATMLSSLLSNPTTTYDLREASACSLGTCDHVIAHIDGPSLGVALGGLLGAQLDAATQASIPNFVVDVLVDQATSVISELRTQISMGGSSEQILLQLTNPGQPVQILPPLAALTDDFGGDGGQVELGATPAPVPAESIP